MILLIDRFATSASGATVVFIGGESMLRAGGLNGEQVATPIEFEADLHAAAGFSGSTFVGSA